MQNEFLAMCRSFGKVDSSSPLNQRKLIFWCNILRKFSLLDFTAQSTSIHHFLKTMTRLNGSLIEHIFLTSSIIKAIQVVNWFHFASSHSLRDGYHHLTGRLTAVHLITGPNIIFRQLAEAWESLTKQDSNRKQNRPKSETWRHVPSRWCNTSMLTSWGWLWRR